MRRLGQQTWHAQIQGEKNEIVVQKSAVLVRFAVFSNGPGPKLGSVV
jgi:hypothetical protein